MQHMDHEDCACHSAEPHRERGHHHCEFDIARCPEAVRGDETHRTENGLHDRDQKDHLQAERRRIRLTPTSPIVRFFTTSKDMPKYLL